MRSVERLGVNLAVRLVVVMMVDWYIVMLGHEGCQQVILVLDELLEAHFEESLIFLLD